MIKQSLRNTLHRKLLDDILIGDYKANDIMTEKKLAEKYNVSRATVREVLIELCAENVLTSIPRCGYQVKMLLEKDVKNAYELRTILEVTAFQKTIKTISSEQIFLLKEHIKSCNSISQDVILHWEKNMKFHLLLCSFCNNSFLYEALETVLKVCLRSASQYLENIWADINNSTQSNHKKIIDALEKFDYKLAEKILIHDIAEIKNSVCATK